jgi:hypothetical protein
VARGEGEGETDETDGEDLLLHPVAHTDGVCNSTGTSMIVICRATDNNKDDEDEEEDGDGDEHIYDMGGNVGVTCIATKASIKVARAQSTATAPSEDGSVPVNTTSGDDVDDNDDDNDVQNVGAADDDTYYIRTSTDTDPTYDVLGAHTRDEVA